MHITGHNLGPLANDISGTDKMSLGWAAMMSTTRGKIKSEKKSEEGKIARIKYLSAVQEIFNFWHIMFHHRTQMVRIIGS